MWPALALLAPSLLLAQRVPAVRPIGTVSTVSPSGLLASVSAVRALSDGGVIVNDVTGKQLVLLDANLKLAKAIADTSLATGRGYGSALAGLLPFRGDSSLFIEPRSISMLVIDPSGNVARVMAIPNPADASYMVGGPFGAPGYDVAGRIVYRGGAMVRQTGGAPQVDSLRVTALVDSAPVFRLSLETRTRETIGYVAMPRQIPQMKVDRTGKWAGMSVLTNPMPIVDAWTLLSDGRVAIVRGNDFRIDWYSSTGEKSTSQKIPFNWERLDDEAKRQFLDSTRVEVDKAREALKKAIEANPSASAQGTTMTVMANPEGGAGREGAGVMVPTTEFIDAKALADYRPAFRMGAALADDGGNLWVRTTTPSEKGPIYAVIDGKGQLVDRVQVPFGRTIVGFGKGVVFMGVQDEKGARLEKAAQR